jgi:Chromo (CHRromatin Organisation MOdifier) domain
MDTGSPVNSNDDNQTGQPGKSSMHWDIGNDVYSVEKLLATKGVGENKQYLVKWKSTDGQVFPNQWVKKRDITNKLVEEFHRRKDTTRV